MSDLRPNLISGYRYAYRSTLRCYTELPYPESGTSRRRIGHLAKISNGQKLVVNNLLNTLSAKRT
ncbi:hypothetical protein QR685DRAFT_449553 [Neurospora intermedia]|uniref:Uncharacterized protein n=1 Tax=Neurospora intermedia TaxID=5142 RepID=A0ABR3D317_NEUIN